MQTAIPRGHERRDWNRAQSLSGTEHRDGVLGRYMSGNPTNEELSANAARGFYSERDPTGLRACPLDLREVTNRVAVASRGNRA